MLVLGGSISKIYKSKNKGQLIVYLPFDVVKVLGLKEGDDLDFLPYEGRFIIAKKSDLVALMIGKVQPAAAAPRPQAQSQSAPEITSEELTVLRKLDSIRYSDRTKERLKKELNESERKVLNGLMKKKFVDAYKKSNEQQFRYGIAKSIYSKYLFGKREKSVVPPISATQQQQTVQVARQPEPKKWEKQLAENVGYLSMLEANGYLVVANQAEAATISTELEESIRRGLVIGTRAFDKKYYITLKAYVAKNAPKIMKVMTDKAKRVSDISAESGVDEDGIRAILYMLAEQGEVTETRKDFFRLV